ncbi:hypothetical protein ABK01_08495 [Treponema sp. OMZ 305]|uniref:hypothetical protein n=1 Tax=Treponema sp. OMZ 305 TaxID=1659192 RepID=UPI0020A3F6FC|nr:hypothetical protein [Treponema sp. OMZ 305]UTC58297.1 hypothetical protein ABK01_08495 [Treponema sp. OMZ 305]
MHRNSKPLFCFFIYFLCSLSLFAAKNGLAIYVDATAKTTAERGTSDSPFGSLEQAVAAAYDRINRQEAPVKNGKPAPVSVFLRSNVYVEEALFLTIPIKIISENAPVITFGENAGFVVERTSLEIKGCSVKRSERFTEPRTVPVVYGSNASVTLNKVSITVKEGGDAVILRDSRITCTDTSFTSEQSAQAVLVRAKKSTVSALRSTFSASGLMVLCFDFVKTQCTLTDTVCNLAAHYTGRLAELTGSTVKMRKLQCSYTSPLFEMMDAAIIADNASKAELPESVEFTGFEEALVRR